MKERTQPMSYSLGWTSGYCLTSVPCGQIPPPQWSGQHKECGIFGGTHRQIECPCLDNVRTLNLDVTHEDSNLDAHARGFLLAKDNVNGGGKLGDRVSNSIVLGQMNGGNSGCPKVLSVKSG